MKIPMLLVALLVASPSIAGETFQSEEYVKGYGGVRGSNVFNPKFQERLKTYAEQVDMGLSRGWLTAEEGTQFKVQLDRLNKLEETVRTAGYPKDQLDNLEKEITRFNMDLTSAANKPAKAATPPPAEPAVKAEPAKKAVEVPAVPAKPAQPKKAASGKPAAKAAVKAAVKKKTKAK
jgi:hypothetical protein